MPPARLVGAVRRIMRPLTRLLISHQLTYPLLIRLLKSVYVEVAETDFAVDNAPLSDSRINLLTGVHRKEIKKLRAEPLAAEPAAATASLGAQLVAEWMGSERYADAEGKPRPLPLKTSDPAKPGFDTLVAEVCRQNIRPRVILDEWTQLGVAHLEQGNVVLNTGAFTPERGFDEKIFFFARNLRDHIAAGSDNLRGRESPHFDRGVFYDNLGADSIEELKALADELGMQALTQLNRRARALREADAARADARYRIHFGVFNYTTSPGAGDPRRDKN